MIGLPRVRLPASHTVRSVSRSHVGRVRSINEDRIYDDPAVGVWAIADGMGGHCGGDLAAQQVIDSVREAACGRSAVSSRRLSEALQAANRLIHARNQRLRLNAGATVVAATFAGDMLEIAWAGDSRAYRLRGGHLEQLTRDHSVVQQLVDRGLLTPAMAESHPQAHVVTRALGVDGDLLLDAATAAAGADRFLLCSDGLSRSLRDADVAGDLPLSDLADRLMAGALERDGSDNISLVLIELAPA